MTNHRRALIALLTACTLWGLSPLFYIEFAAMPPTELIAHRVVWSVILFTALLAWQRRLPQLWATLSDGRSLRITVVSGLLVSVNWGFFVYSIFVGRVTEASLGYYIFPLMAVLLGVVILRERLHPLQWLAIAMAALGVLYLSMGLGATPWIALLLASTFSLYGLIKRGLSAGPVVSVTAETWVLLAPALGWLIWLEVMGQGVFGHDLRLSLLLPLTGIQTALPLILFSRAAQGLPFATVGIVQYLNPSLQFLCATLVFAEAFTRVHTVAFALIWIALALYSSVAVLSDRARRKASMVALADPAGVTISKSDGSAKP